jgi:hypothetical protein
VLPQGISNTAPDATNTLTILFEFPTNNSYQKYDQLILLMRTNKNDPLDDADDDGNDDVDYLFPQHPHDCPR